MSLRVIIFWDRDANVWQAQCLEHDITTQASELPELDKRLDATVRAEIEECLNNKVEPLSDIPEAPKYYFDMWENRYGSITPEKLSYPEHDSVSFQHAICA